MVLVWHYISCQLHPEAGAWVSYVRRALYLTGTGVDLFFVLSGFLIVGILLDQKSAPKCLKVFYLRRACRIFPVYFLLLVSFIALANLEGWPASSHTWMFGNAMPLWSYATFTQNIVMGIRGEFGANAMAVTWSLAVEEQFYLVIPFVVLLVSGRKLAWALPFVMIGVVLLRVAYPGFHTYINTPWRADSLLAGAVLALLVRSEKMGGNHPQSSQSADRRRGSVARCDTMGDPFSGMPGSIHPILAGCGLCSSGSHRRIGHAPTARRFDAGPGAVGSGQTFLRNLYVPSAFQRNFARTHAPSDSPDRRLR